jgi:hypothetical protein
LAGKRRNEYKSLVKFQLIVTLDKVIHINSTILIVVYQPQFTKKIGLPSVEKIIIKIAHIGHLGLDVYDLPQVLERQQQRVRDDPEDHGKGREAQSHASKSGTNFRNIFAKKLAKIGAFCSKYCLFLQKLDH